MKLLKDILYKASLEEVIGYTNIGITEICADSRMVKPGCAYVAIVGSNADGHNYISKAIASGAKAIVCQVMPQDVQSGITYVKVSNSAIALGYMAANFYNNPSGQLQLIGITGTNGKTTTATLLYQLFKDLGYKTGLLSTVKNKINDTEIEATHTTPDALTLHKLLQQMVEAGCTHAFMEVSSHAVVQQRIAGVQFAGAVFTNITHDHLDYHKTFDAYIAAKKGFFDGLPDTAFALTNDDDKNGKVMLQNTKAKKYTYALRTHADFKCKVLENNFGGLMLQVNKHEVLCKLVGTFNAYNIVSVYGTAVLLGEEPILVLKVLSNLQPPAGRFEYVVSNQITGIVDYAHTPDAVKNVLATIGDIRTGNEKVITVIGCGGDRDKTKRPEMAKLASMLSNKVIITSDNPRSENPLTIIAEMQAGVPASKYKNVLAIADRKEAIRTACNLAAKGDIILVAGKGHEKYQEIQGVKYPFDDLEILTQTLNQNQIQ